MKKSLLLAALLAALPILTHADDLDALRKTLSERMKGAPISSIVKLPNFDLYEAVANGVNVFYTDAKGDIAFFGPMIDLKNKRNLTELRVQELSRVDFASLPFAQAMVQVKGKGTRKLAIFSDPECPYCQQLEKELSLIDDVTIYTFLLPITELHPGAAKKSQAIWCSVDPVKAWGDYMLRGIEPVQAKPACEAPLMQVAETAKRLRIEGTPGIIFPDGTLQAGTLDSRVIEKRLHTSVQAVAKSK